MAKKEVKKIEKLVESLEEILTSFGNYLETLGKVEKEDKDFRNFMERAKSDPTFLAKTLEKIPPEYTEKILSLFLRMALLSSRTQKLTELSAEDKIKFGKALKKIASDFGEVVREVKSKKSKK